MSGALSFAAAAGDASMSSDSGAQGGLVFPGLHGTETGREFLTGFHPRPVHRKQPDHTPSFLPAGTGLT